MRAPTHFDCGGQRQPRAFQLTARREEEKKSRDHFCCFLDFIKLSICLFLVKVQCVKFHPAFRKGPWCVPKENRGIVQNMTAGFTYCSTGC